MVSLKSVFIILLSLSFLSSAVQSQNATIDKAIVIPVVVHIVYNKPEQNISNEQVRSQIAVLNADYRMRNKDISHVPAAFKNYAADSHIEFRLATLDPAGLPTNGIIRKASRVAAFELNDQVKSSVSGGDDGWNRDEYLNIWICNISGGILGYASAPGCAPEKDGVVIRYDVFGATSNLHPPYNKGRTSVHEIGHWLGLKHIWGDKACGDDNIDDTPPQQGPTRGCPSGIVSTCASGSTGNMYMNFMDFTNDECVNMFTHGQVSKMHELFKEGGARNALLQSAKAAGSEESGEWVSKESVSVYPNPVVNELTIRIADPEAQRGQQLIIFNHLGQATRTIPVNKSLIQVNTTQFAPGVYYLSVGKQKTIKFVKAK